MTILTAAQRIRPFSLLHSHPLDIALRDFLLDVEAANRSRRTRAFYAQKLQVFSDYLKEQGVTGPEDITPAHVRAFLVNLSQDHNPGGVLAYFRAVRAFLRFARREGLIDHDPLRNVRTPKADLEPLQPVSLDVLNALLATCDKSEWGLRDRALLLALLDTGCRAGEFLHLDIGDVNLNDGSLLVRKTKARRPRMVFLGRLARQALFRYLRARPEAGPSDPLWLARPVHDSMPPGRLTYSGLVSMLRRRAKAAGVPAPMPHSFRRAFALTMLRSGADLVSIQRLLGHSDLSVLNRYLRQEAADLAQVHRRASPVDRLLRGGR